MTGILLFTWYGYQPLLHYLQTSNETAISTAIAEEQFESDLVSIKIATQLPPYATDSRSFEWVRGEVEVEGRYYQYVKRRIFKDSIEYLCVADHGRQKIENARENFFRLCNDLSTTKKSDAPQTVVKPFAFETVIAADWIGLAIADQHSHRFHPFEQIALPAQHSSTPEQPPEVSVI